VQAGVEVVDVALVQRRSAGSRDAELKEHPLEHGSDADDQLEVVGGRARRAADPLERCGTGKGFLTETQSASFRLRTAHQRAEAWQMDSVQDTQQIDEPVTFFQR